MRKMDSLAKDSKRPFCYSQFVNSYNIFLQSEEQKKKIYILFIFEIKNITHLIRLSVCHTLKKSELYKGNVIFFRDKRLNFKKNYQLYNSPDP